MNDMHIRLLTPDDAEIYRELRLQSLKENPEAFLSTYEAEKEKPIVVTRDRMESSDSRFTLGAFIKSANLIGIVTFVRESNAKTDHKGNVYAMYVVPGARGQGTAKALMNKLIETARTYEGLERINLAVISDNIAAKKLYLSLGFEVYGTERKALKSDSQYWNEDFMVKVL